MIAQKPGSLNDGSAWKSHSGITRFVEEHPCLWIIVKELGIPIKITDLFPVYKSNAEWFSPNKGICLEALKIPLSKISLSLRWYSRIPLSQPPSKTPHETVKSFFWRRWKGIGHFSTSFNTGDYCFTISRHSHADEDFSSVLAPRRLKHPHQLGRQCLCPLMRYPNFG